MEDLISSYLTYVGDTEVPAVFNRWAIITGLGALLGRQYHLDHGHFNIYPNVYCMLIGTAGTRKGTSIKLLKKLLTAASYTKFSAERTSKEKFLLDLAGEGDDNLVSPEELLDQNLFGGSDSSPDCEVFIAIDEFNDFLGNGNIEFISMLGNMWDYHGLYTNRIKTGKSVSISNPTISILGGNTPTGFSLAFPPDIFGQGFFSRIILVYGEPSGKRITFPKAPSDSATTAILEQLRSVKSSAYGSAKLGHGAERVFDEIYQRGFVVDDVRFQSYSNRRFTHLLKLSLIVSAARSSSTITPEDIIYANTVLTFAERNMPRALGEFGRSKHAEVAHKVLELLHTEDKVWKFKTIWAAVANDLDKMADLATLLQNMVVADKIIQVPGGAGFLAKRKMIADTDSSLVDFSLLTAEERKMIV